MSSIPPNHKFACIPLQYPPSLLVGSGSVQVTANVRVERKAPFPLNEGLRRELGDVLVERIEEANLFLLCIAPSSASGIMDAENNRLGAMVQDYLFCLALVSPLAQNLMLLFKGGNNNGNLWIPDVALVGEKYLLPGLVKLPPIADDTFHAAGCMLPVYVQMTKQPPSTPATPKYRLAMALASAIRNALHEQHRPERHHQFTRAMEAIIKPSKSATRDQFKSRMSTFVQAQNLRTVFGEIFDMRSAFEHLHMGEPVSFNSYAPDKKEEVFGLRCFQMEAIVRRVYQRLLSTPSLLHDLFNDEAALDQFWSDSNSTDDRRKIWGDVVDLSLVDKYYELNRTKQA